jgi:hypothetical protein
MIGEKLREQLPAETKLPKELRRLIVRISRRESEHARRRDHGRDRPH